MVERLHAQGELGGGDGVLLADEDDLLGVLGDVVRLIHFGELLELLALVGEDLLAAFERLTGGFLAGLAADLGEIGVFLLCDLGCAADGFKFVRRGFLEDFRFEFGLGEGEGTGCEFAAGVFDFPVDVLGIETNEDVTLGNLDPVLGDLEDFKIRPGLGFDF